MLSRLLVKMYVFDGKFCVVWTARRGHIIQHGAFMGNMEVSWECEYYVGLCRCRIQRCCHYLHHSRVQMIHL